MILPHNEATATVTIDGLAICCFNRKETKWDLAFLHHRNKPAHRLILQVQELHRSERLPEQTRLLTFETVNGHYPNGFPDGFFDNGRIRNRRVEPVTQEEKENFRWVMDLEDPHDVNHGNVTLKKPSFPVTRAYIENAVFYTSARSPKELILLPDGQDPNQTANPTFYGKTNDEISADILCDAGGQVVIKIDGEEYLRLDHRPGNPWKICLTHLCAQFPTSKTGFEKGDFHLFYDALNITGNRHALWGEPNTPSAMSCAGINESGRTDCDTVRLGSTGTLDALFT